MLKMFPMGPEEALPNFLFGMMCVAITSLVQVLKKYQLQTRLSLRHVDKGMAVPRRSLWGKRVEERIAPAHTHRHRPHQHALQFQHGK